MVIFRSKGNSFYRDSYVFWWKLGFVIMEEGKISFRWFLVFLYYGLDVVCSGRDRGGVSFGDIVVFKVEAGCFDLVRFVSGIYVTWSRFFCWLGGRDCCVFGLVYSRRVINVCYFVGWKIRGRRLVRRLWGVRVFY